MDDFTSVVGYITLSYLCFFYIIPFVLVIIFALVEEFFRFLNYLFPPRRKMRK